MNVSDTVVLCAKCGKRIGEECDVKEIDDTNATFVVECSACKTLVDIEIFFVARVKIHES